MTSTPDLQPLDGCDDPASVLGFARAQKQVEDQAARWVLRSAVKFASMHTGDSLVGPLDEWHQRALPVGGEGCPEVTESCVAEFAAALGRSTESGRRFLSHAVEAAYRLPVCWERLVAGKLPAWKLAFIAERTMCLSPAAAAFVDNHVAPVAYKIGPAQLDRLIQEAKARFDPEQSEAERVAAAEQLRFDLHLAEAAVSGTVHVEGDLDLADGLCLEAVVAAGASELAALGSTESLNVRRAKAVGEMARAQLALGFDAPDGIPKPGVPRREVVLQPISPRAPSLVPPGPGARWTWRGSRRPCRR